MKKRIIATLLLLLAVSLFGCSASEDEVQDENGIYKIYYINSSQTSLVPVDYKTETSDVGELVDELMYQFLNVPNDVDCQSALSDKVVYQGFSREEQILYLYFDSGYSSRAVMDATREILCRAALTNTMTQIDGIDYINIYVADQPLTEDSGRVVGLLSSSDFVESVSDVNTFERTKITLYFTDETGERLVEEEREVIHSINTSMERLIVDELLEGPEAEGHYPTLSPDTKLLNITVNENVCYLNFDDTFLTNILDVKEYVPIYSLVNSLCGISGVSKVQITVNGSPDVVFRDVLSLNTQFERNLDITDEDE